MASEPSILEFFEEKCDEIKLSYMPSCGSNDRMSRFTAKCLHNGTIDESHLGVIWAVMKETVHEENIIYDLSFMNDSRQARIEWTVRNGSHTIIDDKTILEGIGDCVVYQHDYAGVLETNWHQYEVFTLHFNDVVKIDQAISLAKRAILQTTSKVIYGFDWILRIKGQMLIYSMSWVARSQTFPDFIEVPTASGVRRIFSEDQLKCIISDTCMMTAMKDVEPQPNTEYETLYKIKKTMYFTQMSCIEYFVYVVNKTIASTDGIVYQFTLKRTFYDCKTRQIYHRLFWYVISKTEIKKIPTKTQFNANSDAKR